MDFDIYFCTKIDYCWFGQGSFKMVAPVLNTPNLPSICATITTSNLLSETTFGLKNSSIPSDQNCVHGHKKKTSL